MIRAVRRWARSRASVHTYDIYYACLHATHYSIPLDEPQRPQLVPESVSHSTDASTTNGSAPSATVTATAHPQRPRPSPRQIILRLNDFPYSLDTTITHYCLWSSEELPAEHIERHLAVSFGLARSLSDSGLRHSGSEPPRNAETIADHSIRDGAITTTMRNRLLWFMNPPHRKSVKDVWHVHVFVKL